MHPHPNYIIFYLLPNLCTIIYLLALVPVIRAASAQTSTINKNQASNNFTSWSFWDSFVLSKNLSAWGLLCCFYILFTLNFL